MTVHVRRAGVLHAGPIAELLNEVIAIGGTTAMTDPVTRDDIATWIASDPRAAWHVAEDDSGEVLGVQWVEPNRRLGPTVAEIATFARAGRHQTGIGSALFEVTRTACRDLGYLWINAEIRSDNAGGLAYYQSRGFEDYARKPDVTLGSGQVVDKVLKRFDL